MDSLQTFFVGTLNNLHVSFTTERFVDVRDVTRLHILGLTSLTLSSPGVRFWAVSEPFTAKVLIIMIWIGGERDFQ